MKGRNGSVLTTVMVVISLVALSLTSMWRSALYASKSGKVRLKAAQQHYSMEVFLRYVVQLIAPDYTQVYNSVSNAQDTLLLASTSWPLSTTATWGLKVYARRADSKFSELVIFALSDSNSTFCKKISCRVYAQDKDLHQQVLVVHAWCEKDVVRP